jgi:ABC-2 type transport system permease protein
VTVFLRDPGQWSQLVVLMALVVVYVYNFSVRPIDDGCPLAATMRVLAALFNLGLTAFVTTAVAVRFVYPAVSLEGRSWWILRTAPISLGAIWWSKFVIAFVPLAALGEALVVLTNGFLGVAPALTGIFMATLLFVNAAIVSLGIAFGAAYPRFDTQNPAQIATSFGAVVYMLVCLALVAAVVLLEAWPVSRLFWHRLAEGALAPVEYAGIGLAFATVVTLTVAAAVAGRRAGLRYLAALQA